MKIVDTTPAFFQLLETEDQVTIETLNCYYAQYPELFDHYFERHCPRTEERLTQAIKRYPAQVAEAKLVAERLPAIIEEVMGRAVAYFGFDPELEFFLLVGGFGSNAYVDLKKGVYFAVEKLSANPDHLRVIVAHEIGHLYHLRLLAQAGIDWSKVRWDGLAQTNWEGVATYISQQLVPGQPEATLALLARQELRDVITEWLRRTATTL